MEFKIKFMHAVEIMELVKGLNDRREKELVEGVESMSLDKKGKVSDIDASRNVHASADVTLYQLFDKGYIKKDDPLLYYRKTNTPHNTVFSVRKIVNVDNNSRISTLLPNNTQPLRSNYLTELEKTVVEDFNEKHNLDGDKKLKPNKNPFPYFFIGTSLFELRKKYCENN